MTHLFDPPSREKSVNPFDAFIDPFTYPTEGVYNRSGYWRPLPERYIELGWRIHLHFRGIYKPMGNREPRDYCITLEWPEVNNHLLRWNNTSRQRADTHAGLAKLASSQYEGAVLVEVMEFMKLPKGTKGVLPCYKRLQLLDLCDALSAKTFQHPALAIDLRSKPSLVKIDRKTGSAMGRPAIVNDELPKSVIQARAEIVQNLPNSYAEHRIRLLTHFDPKNNLPAFIMYIDERHIGYAIEESADFRAQGIDLFSFPVQLKPIPSEFRDHE